MPKPKKRRDRGDAVRRAYPTMIGAASRVLGVGGSCDPCNWLSTLAESRHDERSLHGLREGGPTGGSDG